MKLNVFVTLLVSSVLMLASINKATASTSANTPNSNNSTTTSVTNIAVVAPAVSTANFRFDVRVTRSTNLIDFQDGTRNDSLGYEFTPTMVTSFGTFITSISYSQNLRDKYSTTASDWGDIPVIFAFPSSTWKWSARTVKLSYSLTGIVPVSKYSVIRDQLQTALSGRIGLSLMPSDGPGFGTSIGLSLGRNFHAYEENINGNNLNQYSSNQSIGINYVNGDWSFSVDFSNRTSVTYKNSVKSLFDINEEIGYSINDNISCSIGHTNAGSTLRANGTDSNINLYNENNSTVYGTLGLSY